MVQSNCISFFSSKVLAYYVSLLTNDGICRTSGYTVFEMNISEWAFTRM